MHAAAPSNQEREPGFPFIRRGNGLDNDKQQTAETGFDHHVIKPLAVFQFAELPGGIEKDGLNINTDAHRYRWSLWYRTYVCAGGGGASHPAMTRNLSWL
jgi:hypothetical protein